MKKTLVLAGMLLASVCASAQNYFGVTAGYNLSTLSGADGLMDISPKSGFNAGIAYEHRFSGSDKGNLFLGANVLYSLEGYHYKLSLPTGPIESSDMVLNNPIEYDEDVDIKYLKIPVSFGYNFKLSDNFGLAPKVFGILESQLGVEHDDSDSVLDFAFGAGLNLNIGERWSVGLGYDWNPELGDLKWCNAHANVTYYIFSK